MQAGVFEQKVGGLDAYDLFDYFLEFSCEVVRIVGRL